MIELAGGLPMLMEEGADDDDDSVLVAPRTCVMSTEAFDASQMTEGSRIWVTHVMKYLKK